MVNKSVLVFYCSWGGGGGRISKLHNLYIDEALKHYDKVVLITNESKDLTSVDSEINGDVEVWWLPPFNSYLSALPIFFEIKNVIKLVLLKYPSATYYIRTPEPFSWLFHFYKYKKSKLVYHFVSNPLEAILKKKHTNVLTRLMKFISYFPEFLLTTSVAKKNHVSCNGLALKENLSLFLPGNTTVLNESTLSEGDFISSNDIKPRVANSPIKILFVGYLREAKGVDNLLSALLLLKSKNREFEAVIVGSGVMETYLKKLVLDNKLESSICFKGHVSERQELSELYFNSDLFVFPSLSEGSPRVVIEAMAKGSAVISTNVGNTRNLIEGRGLCIKPGSVNAICQAIEYYLDNENIRYQDSINALEFSRSFTLDNFFKNFKDI